MRRSVLMLMLIAIFFLFTSISWAKMASIKSETVRIRSGPGTGYSVLYEVFAGYPLKVLRQKGKWARVVDFEGDIGWTYRPLLSNARTVIVSQRGGNINIRSGPGTRYKVKGQAEYGVVFRLLEKKGSWAKVRHDNGLTGWIHRKLLWGD